MGRSWIWSGTARATSRIPTSLVAFGCAPLSSSPSLPPSLCLSLPKAPKLAKQKAPHCQHLLAYAHDASIRAHVAGELQALRAVAGQLRERGQGPAAAEPLHQVQHGAASPAPGDAAVPADLFPPLPHLPGPHTRSCLQLGCSAWFCEPVGLRTLTGFLHCRLGICPQAARQAWRTPMSRCVRPCANAPRKRALARVHERAFARVFRRA